MEITLERCIETQNKLGYPIYEKGNYNLNFLGIRNKSRESNTFDDLLVLYYKIDGKWQFKSIPATLDPGLTYLKTPFSPEAKQGTAIVAPGFYGGLWSLGMFKGKRCLLQRTPIKIYRDNNWDDKLDLDPRTIEQGMYGILVHPHFQTVKRAKLVWNSSAGCQVPQNDDDCDWLMNVCNTSIKIWGNSISYGLIHEENLV